MRSEVLTGTWKRWCPGKPIWPSACPATDWANPAFGSNLWARSSSSCVAPTTTGQGMEPLDPCELARHRIVAVFDTARG